eukprot:11748059-Alexandrium_andersonii.AAC.1
MVRSESAGLGLTDKHMAIEAVALRESLQLSSTAVRWFHSEANPADGLTKYDAICLKALMKLILTGVWMLVYDPNFVSARRRKQAGQPILADTDASGKVKSH